MTLLAIRTVVCCLGDRYGQMAAPLPLEVTTA
jgi:hypothetical protein